MPASTFLCSGKIIEEQAGLLPTWVSDYFRVGQIPATFSRPLSNQQIFGADKPHAQSGFAIHQT